MQARTCTALVLAALFNHRHNLTTLLEKRLGSLADPRDKAFAQELCYGVMRWFPRLDYLLTRLLRKPIKSRDNDIKALILSGLYQFEFTRVPPHAVVSASVESCVELGKPWAKALVNALLRNYMRNSKHLLSSITDNTEALYAHPAWLLEHLQKDYPDHWEAIATANNQRPPMFLRVNLQRTTVEDYLKKLGEAGIKARAVGNNPQAIQLVEPVDITALPHFENGAVSVQDLGAQWVTEVMDLRRGHRLLDACAAPGGKLAQLLEQGLPLEQATAIEIDAQRCKRLRETLQRLGLSALVKQADICRHEDWWEGKPFDRILADVPCSGTGVIRRHPDIKYLKRPADIAISAAQQREILETLWQTLDSGGKLIYVTCSVLSIENDAQISAFTASHQDATLVPVGGEWGNITSHGRQILPGDEDMDGFYYACIQKS